MRDTGMLAPAPTVRVFITGVAGFLGSHLADTLLAQGYEVVGNDNLIGGDIENVPKGVEFHRIDCNNLGAMKLLLHGVDVVWHCAATAHEGLSVFSPHENAMHGYAASSSVFSAACAAKVRRVVTLSSMARYGKQDRLPFDESMVANPVDPYGVGKLASEAMLKILADTHGLEWTVAVPHNIQGMRQRYWDPFRNVAAIMVHRMISGKQPIIYGDGKQERCFSHVSDCVSPLVQMGFSNDAVSEVINIGPDEGVVTVLQLAQKIAALLDFPLDPIFMPDRPCEVKIAHCSANKARRLLGYEPKVSLEHGLEEMIAWIRERGPRPFQYHLDIEIVNENTPRTWLERRF
jgi:UDP-glucose 4-epimerase